MVKHFFNGFMNGTVIFGHLIRNIINFVLLSAIYIIVIGFMALIAKLLRKHFLDLKLRKEAKTYWTDLNLGKRPIEKYYRQF